VRARTVALPRFAVQYGDVQFDAVPVLPTPLPHRPRLQFPGWLLMGWLAVAAGLMALLTRRSHRVAASTKQAIPAPDPPEQLLEACRRQMRIRRRIYLRLSTTLSSPAVYGLWRPVILIPQRLADKLSAPQLRAVLLHELAHIKRGDVLAHYAQTLLQIIYWWHPLLWLANARIRHLREQAVDEMVMVEMGGEAEAYPATLLEVAKLTFQRPALVLGLIGIVESRSALAQRIKHLLDRPVPNSARLGYSGLALVLLAGAFLLPMARAQRKPDGGALALAASPLDELAVVDLDVEFISTADGGLENLGLGQPALALPNGHLAWVLSSAQREDLLRRIERESGVVARSAPTITTTSGHETQLEISGVEPFKHPQAQTIASCQVTPYLRGTLIDLSLSAKITETGEVGSASADDLKPDRKRQTSENEPEQISAANAIGSISYDVGTAQISVGDGESVVLENPGLRGADGKRMLTVVSPRVIRRSAALIAPNSNDASVGASSGDFRQAHVDNHVSPTPPRKSGQSQPASTAAKENTEASARESVTVTIGNSEPYFYLGSRTASLEDLKTEFKRAVSLNPAVTLLLRADNHAPIGELVKVVDAAKEAKIRSIRLLTPPQRTNADSVPSSEANGPAKGNAATVDATNSPQSQLALGEIRGQEVSAGSAREAKKPSGSPPGADTEIEALKAGEIQYDPQTGVCVLTNDFVGRFKGALLTARRGQINTKTGEVLAEGAVTLQRGNETWRGERLQFNFIQQKILETNAPGVSTSAPSSPVPVLDDLPGLGSVFLDGRVNRKLSLYDTPDPTEPQSANAVRKNESDPAHDDLLSIFRRNFRSESNPSNPRRKAIEAKLNQIILPEVVFDNLPLPEVLRWLAEQARERDPDGIGLNFLLNPNGIGAAPEAMIDPTTGKPVALPPPEPLDMNNVRVRIIAPLKNIRLSDAIEAIVKTADKPIRYSIEAYGIIFSRSPTEANQLETRTFKVDPYPFLERLIRDAFQRGNAEIDAQHLVRDYLAAVGVNLQRPNIVFFNPTTGVLMVRASAQELDLAQKAIESLNVAPPLITIEAKFMELRTDTARRLGFDLPPPGEVSNAWTGVLTAAQARAVLQAAEQSSTVQILAAPKVTTLSGRQTQIQAVEIQTIGNGLQSNDRKSLAFDWYLGNFLMSNSGGRAQGGTAPPDVRSANGVPSQPYVTSQLAVGPTLDLVPYVAADGYTIHLTVLPQVTEFVRPDTTVNGAEYTPVWIDGKKRNVAMPLPIIRTRSIHAAVDVYDGQTLVLANPRVTVVSKQPTGESA
ncbi:MAG TPA: M56 family metallopeptidase, partial [Haliangiales bacterium]|nr:M56 family metallopeptidase [Haliangiales bacterium]